jgi:hypothetical protein
MTNTEISECSFMILLVWNDFARVQDWALAEVNQWNEVPAETELDWKMVSEWTSMSYLGKDRQGRGWICLPLVATLARVS